MSGFAVSGGESVKELNMKRFLFALGLAVLAPLAIAEDSSPIDAPAPPPQVESGEVLEPGVEIIESEEGTIHKYSHNGRVYMVKVVPASGPPYYFLDTDGDGELDARADNVTETSVHQWKLFSW